ncbi:MAG: hypothetical protein SGJ00_03245 [bacterium]|nr:hypothetical protein [bacterium]
MKTNYVCYDFERPFINFYIGLCGVMMQDDKPLIEAKRLQSLKEQLDLRKFPIHPGNVNYSPNPFIPLVSGMFYEFMGEPNDALISYKKALEAYENKFCFMNDGVEIPNYLVSDVYHLMNKLGFYDQAERFKKQYKKLVQTYYAKQDYLLLLVEEGYVPVKEKLVGYFSNGNGPFMAPQKVIGEVALFYIGAINDYPFNNAPHVFVDEKEWEAAIIAGENSPL